MLRGRAPDSFEITVSFGSTSLTADDVRRHEATSVDRIVALPWFLLRILA